MILRSKRGYIRRLNSKDFCAMVKPNHFVALAALGFTWLPTRMGLGAEVRRGSIEHQILSVPLYFDEHAYDPKWADSCLFLFSEVLFFKGQHPEFCALIIARPAIAEFILGAKVRWHKNPCSTTCVQNLVRSAYAQQAARAALQELQK